MEGRPFGLMGSSEVRGRYEVLKQIGEGGFGNVYKARRRDDKVVVALKEVHHAQSSRRELDALLRLSHPNVVKLLDYVQQGSSVVLVLEYVESNLAEVIAAGPLQESAIKGIMVQILRGLAACHSSMIVHRDLKPSNILVSADGVLKIADFGIARVIQQSLVEWDSTRKKSSEMGPLSASERVERCRTVVPHENLLEPASELRAKQPKGEVGSSSSSSQCTLKIPPKRVLKSTSGNGVDVVQGGTGWISPSGRFDFLRPAALGYENEEESSNAEFYYPGRLDVEARNGSDWGSPSEPFDFIRVRTAGEQSESKSSLSDVSNIDGTEFGLQLNADSSLKHWSDVEKESESGQDGWEKASGEWSTDRDGLTGDLEGPHSGSLARSEETKWFGAPELRDSYLEVDSRRSIRGLAGEQGWDEMHQDSPLQLASKSKDASLEAAVQVPSNREKAWVDPARASGRHAEESRMGLSDGSVSRSGSEDNGELTNWVGTRWYRAPELLYGATEYGRAVDLWSVGLIFAEILMGAPLFPGLNDIDQLSRIVRFLGSPTESNWPGVSKLPDYDKIFFQDNRPPLSLHDKFPTASKACLSFLEKLLVYNPAARVDAHEALKDDFFTVHPAPAAPHELKLPTHQRKTSNPQQCGEWSEQLSSLSDFELLS